jgi:GntR family transcriptional regulator
MIYYYFFTTRDCMYIIPHLEVPQNSAILFRKRLFYDKADKPIEYNLGYYKAESFTYTVESVRE